MNKAEYAQKEIEYNKEIEFIFNQFPSYQKVGKVAYKPGIETMQKLDEYFGWPHRSFKTIHIAGTNGKGSTSHMIAAGLMGIDKGVIADTNEEYIQEYVGKLNEKNIQEFVGEVNEENNKKIIGEANGKQKEKLKVGLYTSPHLVDFRERIKVDGEMVSKEFVYNFIKNNKNVFLELKASFFEITTAMAFCYFKECGVDVAVIECGLGGRLDSTNVITPLVSVITNIGLDHCEHLGYSLPDIAFEKSGIIKPNIPVIIGERGEVCGCKENSVAEIFISQAKQKNAPIYFAEDNFNNIVYNKIVTQNLDLKGICQEKNIKTVSTVLGILQSIYIDNQNAVKQNIDEIIKNITIAAKLTGLRGRWETLKEKPLVICDTGHNAHGFRLLGEQISNTYKKLLKKDRNSKLYIVFGVVADKDLDSIKDFLPKEGYYFFVHSTGSRSLRCDLLGRKMLDYGFKGEIVNNGLVDLNIVDKKGNVKDGLKKALGMAKKDDFIFVGGSTFVVAEAMDAC